MFKIVFKCVRSTRLSLHYIEVKCVYAFLMYLNIPVVIRMLDR